MAAPQVTEYGGDEIDAPEMVRVRRRQSRAADTRAKILAAATEEFASAGFGGATSRSIADRAQVPHALVIYHYQTKLGVWQAVMKAVLGSFNEATEARLEGLRGVGDVETLRLIMADFIRGSAEHPELHWLMSHEAGRPSDRLDWLVENLVSEGIAPFKRLIASAQRSGQFVQGDPTHLVYLFIGAAVRIFMVAGEVERISGRSPFDCAYVDEHIDLCERLFFRDRPAI